MFMSRFEELPDPWKMRWGRGILMFSVMKEKMGKWSILNEEKFTNIQNPKPRKGGGVCST